MKQETNERRHLRHGAAGIYDLIYYEVLDARQRPLTAQQTAKLARKDK